MSQVSVSLNGRVYRLEAEPGDEQRLKALAEHVRLKFEQVTAEFGNAGADRLLFMAALLVADELWDARALLATVEAKLARPSEPAAPPPKPRAAQKTETEAFPRKAP